MAAVVDARGGVRHLHRERCVLRRVEAIPRGRHASPQGQASLTELQTPYKHLNQRIRLKSIHFVALLPQSHLGVLYGER